MLCRLLYSLVEFRRLWRGVFFSRFFPERTYIGVFLLLSEKTVSLIWWSSCFLVVTQCSFCFLVTQCFFVIFLLLPQCVYWGTFCKIVSVNRVSRWFFAVFLSPQFIVYLHIGFLNPIHGFIPVTVRCYLFSVFYLFSFCSCHHYVLQMLTIDYPSCKILYTAPKLLLSGLL